MKNSLFVVIYTCFFFACNLQIVTAQSAQEIARSAFGSTVLLVMEDGNGQPLSLGSGFFVSENEIASNLHVIEGASRGYARVVGQQTRFDIEGITAIDAERDLVILRVTGSQRITLSLSDSENAQVGETVYAVGNPQGLEGTFSQGIVSSIREVGNDKLLQITAPISPGSSGGPVLNSKGEVIGVSVATYRGGQNLNFAIPSNYLSSLISQSGSVRPLTQSSATSNRRSILADLGGRNTEGVVGGQLTWDNTHYQNGGYSFSIRNQLRDNVKDIYCLIIFYDSSNNPIDIDVIRHQGVIPAGLARRVTSRVDASVQKLTTRVGNMNPTTRIEFRILDFEITN